MAESRDYLKQRRNTYGEAPHAARKNIPRAKQRQHQKERSKIKAALAHGGFEAAQVEAARVAKKWVFRKVKDQALGRVVIGDLMQRLVSGGITPSSFRAKMGRLQASSPQFVSDYKTEYRRFVGRPLPAKVAAALGGFV